MIPEEAWEFVPRSPPPQIEAWELIAVRETHLDQRQTLAFLWARALLRAARDAAVINYINVYLPGRQIVDIAAGFIPFGDVNDVDRSGGRYFVHQLLSKSTQVPSSAWGPVGKEWWAFGVVVGVGFEDTSAATIPYAEVAAASAMVSGQWPAFLLVVEPREVIRNKPTNPSGAATSACYVRPRAGKRYYSGTKYTEGILVARHVLVPHHTTQGATVQMATNPTTTTTVGDIDASTTIDAAILDSGAGSIPASVKPLSLVTAVAPGLRVTVDGSVTHFSADVLRVMDDPNYFGNMAAHRAFIDAYGQAGDSGALASGPSGDAVGLYIGRTKAPSEGILQLMRQVTTYFELDLYL